MSSSRDPIDSDMPPGLPAGVSPVRWLSRHDRGAVVEVRVGEQRAVLRWGDGLVLAEAALASTLRSPGLVPPLAWGEGDGRPWVLRSWVEGPTLDVAGEGADPGTLEAWTVSLLATLAELHEAGLVHRDVKAANVVVSADGPVLIDLDLVARSDRAGAAGTPLHVAPEILLGHGASAASDLFSLGVTLALLAGDVVAPDFHARFPVRSFWEASGLDPTALPGALGSLVRQLVRRHPADRPASAREAARRLDGDDATLPDLEMPFLAGRDEALSHLLADLVPERGARACVLITVADPEERAPLLEALHLALTVNGHEVIRDSLDEPAEAAIDRIADGSAAVLLVDGSEGAERCGVGAAAELLTAFPGGRGRPAGTLGLVVDEALIEEIQTVMHLRGLEEEFAHLRVPAWPRLSVRALTAHLDKLTGGASPHETRRLAASLHQATIGRWSDVQRQLARATELEVLRADPPRYTLLRSAWPLECDGAGDARDLAELADGARTLLAVLSMARWAPTLGDLAAAASMSVEELAAAVRELARQRLVPPGAFGGEPVQLLDRRRGTAAWASLAEDRRRELADALWRRAVDVHQPADVCALQRLECEPDEDAVGEVLTTVDRLMSSGRPAAARRMIQAVEARCPDTAPSATRLATARIELTQGDGRRALGVLEEAFGVDFTGAPEAVLAVAAQACEQCGRRADARRLWERLAAVTRDAEMALRARVGLAYGQYLGGDGAATLETLSGDVPTCRDETVLARLHVVRGAALTALSRGDEAREEFETAERHAQASGDPVALALCLMTWARLDRRLGQAGAAVDRLGQAARLFSEAGAVKGRAQALNNLGVLHRDRGELGRARELLLEALSLLRRVGDAHGAASSLGSLAATFLEAGHLGAALETLDRAREVFEDGGHERELAFLDIQQSMALALVGQHQQAAARLAQERLRSQREAGSPALLRAEAVLHLVGDQRTEAARAASRGLLAALDAGDAGETFRCAALLAAARPDDGEAGRALHTAAERLQSPVRRVEAAWRTAGADALGDRERVAGWLASFEEAGRTDLVAATGRVVAALADAADDRSGRRTVSARVAQAADALTDGLAAGARDGTLDRLARLSGPRPPGSQRAAGLSVDWLLACNRRMAAGGDLEDLLLTIVDMAMEVTGARRGFLVLLDGEEPAVEVARNLDHTAMAPDAVRFSRTVVRNAVDDGEPVLTTDAASDERFSEAVSISSFGLRSVLCVPLAGVDGGGALYLDDDRRRAVFDEVDVERVRALADQAAVAIGHQRRRQEIEALNARLAERVAYTERELGEARSALRRQGRVAPVGGLIGDSEAMHRVYDLIERVAPTDLPVLVTGPSGTGKDVVARALHELGERADRPLVVENVAALPASLLESEMFGHARGAFTGAERDRPGLFAEADGGTFVLDEIGELPLELQPKLLRVLESGEYRPVGSRRTLRADVRIVAATNRDLLALVREGLFREDLYYRLNAMELRLPTLAERLEDIPLLVRHFLDQLAAKHGTDKPLDDAVLSALMSRPWPGQVRELANEVRRLYFLSGAGIDDPELVRPGDALAASERSAVDPMPASLALEDVERAAIERALRAASGSKQKAAKLLGISRAGLYAKIGRLGLGEGAGDDD